VAEPKERHLPEFLNVPWNLRDVGFFVLAWLGLQILGGVVLAVLAQYWPAANHLAGLIAKGDLQVSFAFDLVDAALGLGIVWFYLRRYKVGWSVLGWRRVNPLKAALYIGAILVGFVVVADVVIQLVALLVPGFNPNQPQNNEFLKSSGSHHGIAVIALVLLPPVLEETIFRGFVFPAMSKRWGVVWGAVWSSALFGLAHWQANISIYTFVLGLVLCFMYVRLRSIFPGMALHMINNYLAFVAMTSK
jgi:membrane protease YdiL (CAAX protease family)